MIVPRVRVGLGGLAALLALAAGVAAAQAPSPARSPAPAARPAAAAAAPAAPGTGRALTSLHYGDALFEYFQGHTFDALTGLMVSQHFERVGAHGADGELLRGSLLLGYGLHHEAGELFERLLATEAEPAVRDRAWFFLAKVRTHRGLAREAEESLSRIERPLPAPFEEERVLLHAQLLMARGDHAGAAALLGALAPPLPGAPSGAAATPGARTAARTSKAPDSPGWFARMFGAGSAGPAPSAASQVVRFNLGVALVRAGEPDLGRAVLEQIGLQPAADEEQRALRDRANVALGFSALQRKQPAEARRYLQRVRLHGLAANKALLGLGWAAAEQGEAKAALVPWAELEGRPLTDAAVLEARIAVPYAMAELGATAQALERYHDAVRQFEQERGALDASIAAIREGRLLAALLEPEPGRALGASAGPQKLPAPLPHGGHLSAVLASHEFQESFRNLRDLIFVADNLAQGRARLASLQDMLEHRKRVFAERLPSVRERASTVNVRELRARRSALVAELQRAEGAARAADFMDAAQQQAQQRIDRGLAALRSAEAAGVDAGEVAALQERLRRVQGALTWQLTQQYSERLWEAKKALRAADAALAEVVTREATLARAEQSEIGRFDRYATRITALQERIAALEPRGKVLHAEQAAQLQDIAVAELEAQKQRLQAYAVQAHLAIAQLLDQAQLAQRRTDPALLSAPAPAQEPPR